MKPPHFLVQLTSIFDGINTLNESVSVKLRLWLDTIISFQKEKPIQICSFLSEDNERTTNKQNLTNIGAVFDLFPW